ncbi:TetR/AcrR family transcriptional regulator [Microbacterium sp.]|uniref:TetR/AcrR family transcriptional regulator n=1 Tax=Microbacterium sp. TaxID=51671 RepID=UPI0039E4B63D
MSETSTPRRVRKSPDERRAELAAAARDLALREGLDALTLRAVAAEAGVAPGLVAHYAPGMDELVAATFGDVVAGELAEVVALLQRVDPAAERIGILLSTMLDGSRADVTLVWVQAWAIGTRNDALAARVRVEMDDWQAAIAAEVQRGMDAGAFARGDAAAIAWHLVAMIDGLSAHTLVGWRGAPDLLSLTARAVAGLLGVDAAALGG